MAKRLYVGNLKYNVTSDQLKELFEQYGSVTSAQVLNDRETGRSRGFGFVEMANDNEAHNAVESLDGQEYDGRRLNVNEATPPTQSSGPREGGFREGRGGGFGDRDRGGSGGFGGGGFGHRDRGGSGGFGDRDRGGPRDSGGGFGDRDRGRDSGGSRDSGRRGPRGGQGGGGGGDFRGGGFRD